MKEIWTIGHSNHPIERFMALLAMHRIAVLCDVRSSPYSRYASQFNREELKDELARQHLVYVYLGKELGPRSSDPACYENGRVRYDRLARKPAFMQCLEWLRKGMQDRRIALMCAERDPLACHRMILICRHLRSDDIRISHIIEDGGLEDNRDTEIRLMRLLKIDEQDLLNTPAQQINAAYDRQGERIAYEITGKGGVRMESLQNMPIDVLNHDKGGLGSQ